MLTVLLTISVATWNVGLEEKLADQRTNSIIDTINTTNFTIFCANEIWGGPERMKYFKDNLNYKYKYSLIDMNTNVANPACNVDQILSGLPDLEKCEDQLCILKLFNVQQHSPCWACLIELSYKMYAGEKYDLNWCLVNEQWMQTLGLMLLSNVELKNVTWSYLPTAVIPRGYISAWYDDIHVVCTHLTVPVVTYPYPGLVIDRVHVDTQSNINYNTYAQMQEKTYGHPQPKIVKSWMEENTEQAKILHNFVLNDTKVILMGDFNMGEELREYNVSAIDPDSYSILTRNLTDAYKGKCTACMGNSIVNMKHNVIYDHIFTRGTNLNIRRTFDKCDLSDHYGLATSEGEMYCDISGSKRWHWEHIAYFVILVLHITQNLY